MLAPGLAPGAASASFLHGETLDSLPMGMAWFAVIAMPIVDIAIFWKLHVLPGKIAAKRHHPQKDAIHVLRLLLLAFGGLLWPSAWRSSAPQRTAACRLAVDVGAKRLLEVRVPGPSTLRPAPSAPSPRRVGRRRSGQ